MIEIAITLLLSLLLLAGLGALNPGCGESDCCEGCETNKVIGVDGTTVYDAIPAGTVVTQVSTPGGNIGQLSTLDGLIVPQWRKCFCTASLKLSQPDGDWDDVKSWVEDGGRLAVIGEYDLEGFDICFGAANRDAVNDLMAHIGSSMSFNAVQLANHPGVPCDENQSPPPANGSGVPEAGLGITDGVDGVWLSDVCTVNNGTAVAKFNGNVFVAIEQVGDGYVLAFGDFSHTTTTCCATNNCRLWKNYWEKPDPM